MNPTKPIETMAEKNERELKYLYLGIGAFVILVCGVLLIAHYAFGLDLRGYNRRFGDTDENWYWLFLVIGMIWSIFSVISFVKYRRSHPQGK